MTDAAPDESDRELVEKLRPHEPHAARMWNYWMGGTDNYPADRAACDALTEIYPDIVTMAVQSRRFLIRVVRFLTGEAGMRQFLDIGTGLPTLQNTHEVAQAVVPESRIVYVDNDPLVLAHARALLTNTTSEGATAYIDADYHHPDLIITEARKTLDFQQPVAVMFMGVLGYVVEFDELRSIVARVMDAVPPGSYLVLWDGTNTGEAIRRSTAKLIEAGAVPYYLRSPEQLLQCFQGMEIVDPGMVPITQWRPEATQIGQAQYIDAYGAIALKP